MDGHGKRYTLQMLGVFGAYTGSLFGVNALADNASLPVPALVALSLIPVVPAIFMLFVIVAFVRTRDEVQQKIITEATLWGAGLVGILTFSYGFLEGAIDLPVISMIWVFPAILAAQGLALIFVLMRYS